MIVKESWLAALCLGSMLCACASGPHAAQEPIMAGGTGATTQSSGGAAHSEAAVAKARPKPPSPESVTVKEPGGDAASPEEAALFRQLDEAWGQRDDKDGQLL